MFKSYTLTVLGTFACWLIHLTSQAQGYIPQIIPPSPSAAAMAKYGEVPVSTYTGIPSVDIPLYQIQSGPLTVPVSLSYHAGGNKVEDISSNVGLGWTLNGGGSISRAVRGLPDESMHGYFAFFREDFTTYTSNDKKAISNGTHDAQADLFYFSFGQYAGKIIFDSDGTCHIMPQQKFKITPGIGPKKGGSNRWEITTENGTLYIFDKIEISSSTRYSFTGSGITAPTSSIPDYPSSWHLSEIRSPGGRDRIGFEYATEAITRDPLVVYSNYFSGNKASYTETRTTALRLAAIDFPEGKIEINPDETDPQDPTPMPLLPDREDLKNSSRIREVKITDLFGNLVKKFKLQHSYFSAGCSEPICKRLKLDAVVEEGSDGSVSKPYLFEYNAEPLPRRDSYDYDHWGFYNKRGNTSPFPQYQEYDTSANKVIALPGADRRPDPAAAQAGILKKITYPTGGTTYFDYQLNEVISDELPSRTTGTFQKPRVQGNGMAPNSSAAFTITGYHRPGQLVRVRYRITGCTPDSGPDSGGGGNNPSFPDACAEVVIERNGQNHAAFAYYPSEEEQQFLTYLPNGSYVLKGRNAVGDQTYFAELTIETEIDSPNKHAGGLRVARVTNYDDYNPARNSVKEYQYNEGNESTGRLNNHPLYHYTTYAVGCSKTASGGTIQTGQPVLVITQTSNATLSNERGGVVGYGKVTELHGRLGGNGKSEYYYTSIYSGEKEIGVTTTENQFADANRNTFPFGPPMLNREWIRGSLLKKVDYQYVASSPAKFVPVKEVVNRYEAFGSSLSIPGLVIGNSISGSDCEGNQVYGLVEYAFGDRVDASYILKKSTELAFDQRGSGSAATVTEYDYSPTHLQPREVKTTLGSNWKITNRFKYPSDYTGLEAHSGEMAAALHQMVNTHHIHHLPIEKQTWEEKDGQTLLTHAEIVTYKPNGLDAAKIFHLQTAVPMNNIDQHADRYVPSGINAAGEFTFQQDRFRQMISFGSYNNFGKILDFTKADGISQAYIWGYGGTLPVAQVINAGADQVAYTGFESTTGTGNWRLAGPTATDGYKSGSCYTGSASTAKAVPAGEYQVAFWAKGTGAVTVQGVSVPVSGEWKEYRQSFPLAADATVTVNAGGIKLDELRLYPGSSQMSTFDYKPSVGITTSTDLNNVSAHFEYDGQNRLRNVRDNNKNIVKNYRYNVAGSIKPVSEQNALDAAFRVDGITKAGVSLLFTAATTLSGLKYDWDFGDGATAANGGRQPEHTYGMAGTYIVKLTVSNATAYKTSVQWLTIRPADPPVGDGPAPVLTNISISNAQQAYKIDRSQTVNGMTVLTPYREVTLDAAVTVTDGVAPYIAYEWELIGGISPFTSSGIITTTTPSASLTGKDYQETETVRYTVKCRAKGSNNRYSEWFTVYIDFPPANNP